MGWTRLGLRLGPAAISGGDMGSGETFAALERVAGAAEAAGFDCLWLPAPMPGLVAAATAGTGDGEAPARPFPDPFVLAAALAPRTSTIRLGCLETAVTTRAPSLLAKLATSLDVLSGGRGALGYDVGSGTPASLGEALVVVEAMLHRDGPSAAGGHFSVQEAWNEPRLRDGPGPRLVARCASGAGTDDASVVEAVGRLCDGCAFDGGDPELAGRVAAVRAAAQAAAREVAVIGVVAVEGVHADVGGEVVRLPEAAAAVRAGCDALVADLGSMPPEAEIGVIGTALSAALG